MKFHSGKHSKSMAMFCSCWMGGKCPTMSQKPKDLCLFDWKTFPTKTLQQNHLPKCELVLDPPSSRLMKGTGAKEKGPHFPAGPLGLFLASWHILLYRKPWNGVNRRWGGVDLAVNRWWCFSGWLIYPPDSRKKTKMTMEKYCYLILDMRYIFKWWKMYKNVPSSIVSFRGHRCGGFPIIFW